MAARSKTWVCGRLLSGNAGSNAAGRMAVSLVSSMCCQVEVSATECGVSVIVKPR